MDIELLREALKNRDKELYFQIREHFPLELIQAEIQHNLKYYLRIYQQFETEYTQNNAKNTQEDITQKDITQEDIIKENSRLLPPSEPPNTEIVIKELKEYKIDDKVWVWTEETGKAIWIDGEIISITPKGVWVKLSNGNFGYVISSYQLQPVI